MRKAIWMRFAPSQTGSRPSWPALTGISAVLDPCVRSCLVPWCATLFGLLPSGSPSGACQTLSSSSRVTSDCSRTLRLPTATTTQRTSRSSIVFTDLSADRASEFFGDRSRATCGSLICDRRVRDGRLLRRQRRDCDLQRELPAVHLTCAVSVGEASGRQRLEVLPGQRGLAQPMGPSIRRSRSPAACPGTPALAVARDARLVVPFAVLDRWSRMEPSSLGMWSSRHRRRRDRGTIRFLRGGSGDRHRARRPAHAFGYQRGSGVSPTRAQWGSMRTQDQTPGRTRVRCAGDGVSLDHGPHAIGAAASGGLVMNSNSSGEPGADVAGSVSRAGPGSSVLTRRTLVGGVATAGALLSLGGWAPPVAASGDERTPRGPGSVSGAPRPPARVQGRVHEPIRRRRRRAPARRYWG